MAAAKARGGWKGLLEHMYTNGDYPFKFGKLMGTDQGGNKYYENVVDYPYGQHRWVEYADTHNPDATSIPPAWHGWMTQMHDCPGPEALALSLKTKGLTDIKQISRSNATELFPDHVALTNDVPTPAYNHLHNQSQVRERGYKMGNPVVGLPPGATINKTFYYTQPGSPYHNLGNEPGLEQGGGRFNGQKGMHAWDPSDPEGEKLVNGGRVRSLWASDNSASVAPGDPRVNKSD